MDEVVLWRRTVGENEFGLGEEVESARLWEMRKE